MDQKHDLKTRIFLSGLSRKILASRLGLSYNQFCHRLNGFAKFHYNEEHELNKILSEAEQVTEAETEKSIPFYQK